MSTYLLVNILAIAMPLMLSFDKKVYFYRRWKFLFPAIILVMIVFVIWDIIFTKMGVWGFNPIHLSGLEIFNLPIEECLFFITIPYASLFMYDVFKAYIKKDILKNYSRGISVFLFTFSLIMALLSYDKVYTFLTFSFLALYIIIEEFIYNKKYLSRFYFTFLFVLIPFLMVNGVLTGSYITEEVVWYNNANNLDIRLFTIPVEDIFYGMLLLGMNVGFYEFFQEKFIKIAQKRKPKWKE